MRAKRVRAIRIYSQHPIRTIQSWRVNILNVYVYASYHAVVDLIGTSRVIPIAPIFPAHKLYISFQPTINTALLAPFRPHLIVSTREFEELTGH
jgi:hypothetical protein